METIKNEEQVKPVAKQERKIRQIVLETDGNRVSVTKNESAGKIEFIGILQALIEFLRDSK
ncbi:MAG: hypothetical protein WC917_04815 [Bacilli bacterium]|jgi:hypothetical protein